MQTAAPAAQDTREERFDRLMDLARVLADEFRGRAAQYDRENSFPFENFDRLRETGYLYLTAPEEYGGHGVNLLEYCRLQEQLATGCGATAVAANMHWFETARLVEWRQFAAGEHEALLRRVVEESLIFSALYSEPGAGGNFIVSYTDATRVEGGFVLNGRKVFASLSPVMTHAIVSATVADAQGLALLGLLVPRDLPGVTIRETWDAMGMRGSGSHELILTDAFVPASEVLHTSVPASPDLFQMIGLIWFQLGLAAVYTGVATAAREMAVAHCRDFKAPYRPRTVGHLPGNQFRIGEMDVLLGAARAYRDTIAQRWRDRELLPYDALLQAAMAKHFATQQAQTIVDLAMQTVGSAAYLRKHPLERLYRDVRAGQIHPLNADTILEAAGKHALDIPASVEPRWG